MTEVRLLIGDGEDMGRERAVGLCTDRIVRATYGVSVVRGADARR